MGCRCPLTWARSRRQPQSCRRNRRRRGAPLWDSCMSSEGLYSGTKNNKCTGMQLQEKPRSVALRLRFNGREAPVCQDKGGGLSSEFRHCPGWSPPPNVGPVENPVLRYAFLPGHRGSPGPAGLARPPGLTHAKRPAGSRSSCRAAKPSRRENAKEAISGAGGQNSYLFIYFKNLLLLAMNSSLHNLRPRRGGGGSRTSAGVPQRPSRRWGKGSEVPESAPVLSPFGWADGFNVLGQQ